MAKGPLRIALEDLAKTFPGMDWIKGWLERLKTRKDRVRSLVDDIIQHAGLSNKVNMFEVQAVGGLFMLTGWEFWEDWLQAQHDFIVTDDKSEIVGKILRDAVNSDTGRDMAELWGTIFIDPVMGFLEGYGGQDDLNPRDFQRGVQGLIQAMYAAGNIAGLVTELASVGTVDGVKDYFSAVMRATGVEGIGGRFVEELMSTGVSPFIKSYYNRLYRPQRFGAGDLRDLYAAGKITQEAVREEAKRLGWRDRDIDFWLDLAFRNLSQGDIFELYNQGRMTEADAVSRLRAMGYDPADIPFLFILNPKKEENEARDFSVANARAAFREGLMPESDFRALLRELRYQEREIDIIIALEQVKLQTVRRELNIGQLKAAWTENVITDAEVNHWLRQEGYGDNEIEVILGTWKAEAAPTFRKLNSGTILQAYTAAVLDRTQTLGRLSGLGFSQEDALLQVSLTEARNPEAFGRPIKTKEKLLGPGTLSLFVQEGLLSPAQMVDYLVKAGFAEADAQLYTQSAVILRDQNKPRLSQSTIEQAYVTGIFDRTQARERLIAMDFSEADADIILDVVEQRNPDVFHPEMIASTRTPSVSALIAALTNGIISQEEFIARMVSLGYSETDAQMYIALATTNERKATRTLSVAQVAEAYKKGFFFKGEALERLTAQGYNSFDADLLLDLEKADVEDTDEWKSFLSGQLNPIDLIQGLVGKKYKLEDVKQAFMDMPLELVNATGIDRGAIVDFIVQVQGEEQNG